jgi:rRNA maturation endonuclease Nob1
MKLCEKCNKVYTQENNQICIQCQAKIFIKTRKGAK